MTQQTDTEGCDGESLKGRWGRQSQALWLGKRRVAYASQNDMSKIGFSTPSMLKDQPSSVLLDSVNTTLSPTTQVRSPSVVFDSFFSFTSYVQSIIGIAPVPLQFYTCLLVPQFRLLFWLTYLTSIEAHWSLNPLFKLVPELIF